MALTDEQGALVGPFNAYLYSPRVGDLIQALGATLRASENLSRRTQELVILATAADSESEYEVEAHRQLALAAGLSPGDIRAVLAADELPLDDPVEQTALRTARALLATGDIDDADYQKATDVLGPAALVELITLVGYYRLVALHLRVFRVPLP
jgi:4-carboxymuconolactone decarboxylase